MTITLATLSALLLAIGLAHLTLRRRACLPHKPGTPEAIARQAYAGLAGHSYANAGLLLMVALTYGLTQRSDMMGLLTIYILFSSGIYGTILNYRALQLISLINERITQRADAPDFSKNILVRSGIIVAIIVQPAATFLAAMNL